MCTRFDSAENSHTSTLKLVTTLVKMFAFFILEIARYVKQNYLPSALTSKKMQQN